MAEDNRLDLDAADDQDVAKQNLLEDVAAAAKMAKERKEKDKAREAQLLAQARDRTLTYIIVAIAAVILFGIAYWMMFARGSAAEQGAIKSSIQTRPVQTPTYQPPPRYVPPRPPAPPSEPVRRNPSDTYDEGPGTGGM